MNRTTFLGMVLIIIDYKRPSGNQLAFESLNVNQYYTILVEHTENCAISIADSELYSSL